MSNDAKILAGSWLAVLADRLIREMEDAGISEPLAEPITLAAVLADLFRLTETPTPDAITHLIGA